ncbi:hypothetical protein Clacol_010121 [Clathrus columnatus]|uniref:Uncharacterized protein n=1 Tax=Clathrus columnatus TaxID=1419009 RepID=A0AAV5AQQ8_9AGAM|nr:hypothetical protein Clacol_010121 [Clathrus columnatus]
MVSFKSLIVVATAALTVSGAAVSKRDLPGDVTKITNIILQLEADFNATNPQDPNGTTLKITQDLALFSSILDNAAIAEEGQPTLSEQQVKQSASALTQLFEDFADLINGIEAQLPKIKQISGLSEIVATGLSDSESVAADELKDPAVAALFEVLDGYDEVLGLLNA